MKTVIRRPANHGLHLFLSLVTFGLWLPVWAVVAVIGRRETVTVPDTPQDAYGPRTPPPWTGGSAYIAYAGHYWQWNPWANRWERTL